MVGSAILTSCCWHGREMGDGGLCQQGGTWGGMGVGMGMGWDGMGRGWDGKWEAFLPWCAALIPVCALMHEGSCLHPRASHQ